MPDASARDAIRAQYVAAVTALAARLNAGDVTADDWHTQMQQDIRDSYALQMRAGSDQPLTAED